jgi:hypothetical protein
MKIRPVANTLVGLGLMMASPVFAQSNMDKSGTDHPATGPGSTASKQHTQSLNYGNGNIASKKRADGNAPTTVGPGSAAYSKQHAQSLDYGNGNLGSKERAH